MPEPYVIMVEDNPVLLEETLFQLQSMGIAARGVMSGHELDVLLPRVPCNVLIIDVNLPGEDGFSIAKRLFAPERRGIIMLTVRDELEDRLQGRNNGADIYLVKPVDNRELIACIRSLHRRLAQGGNKDVWGLDIAKRTLQSPDGRQLDMTQQEIQMLLTLVNHPGTILGREDIVDALAYKNVDFPEARVNTAMYRLRHKLMEFDDCLRIQTWRNRGYSFIGPSIMIL